ncbi:MAG TPA: DUF885 domain-containing protein [Bryobacteraceae bacterium]|nr:DUF885 domain-containing protein [Bryobacteraceae bacterium]
MTLLATLLTSRAGAQALSDRFFDEYYFPSSPTTATYTGVHKYDGELEDYSKAGVAKRVARLKEFEAAFAKLPAGADRDLLLSTIRASLLDLETVRGWERNPDNYSSLITSSAFTLMARAFAPPETRLRSLISRERKMPKVLAEARANLKNPPRIYTEIAIEQLPGMVRFFEHDVPLAFQAVTDKRLLAEFETANRGVMAALNEYQAFLKNDLLARSHGDFRLGAENFSKKLMYEEMVDLPLDRLLEIGYADLRANQEKFRQTAAAIDPGKTPQQILAELEKEHPTADKLLDAYRAVVVQLRDYITARKIVTIPSPVLPILEETPPFARALTFASMDTPGPYEAVAKEAFFNVTLPEKDWPADRVEDFLRGSHRGVILSTAIHEAYPGHYVQFLWLQGVPSRVRKLLSANTFVEGWAHYCEQMMFDEGYTGDPWLKLGQVQDALLRDARYIAGIRMHTGRMTFEQSVDFFVQEGFQAHETALRETKRGTSDPTYLYYTLGKLQILKLREDYRKVRGAQFSLQEFHDRLLSQGYPPLKIVRRAMLGDDSPTL